MHNRTLNFARQEGFSTTTLGVLNLSVSDEKLGDDDILRRLIVAITAWVSGTPEGRALWESSCEDLNVGDLVHLSGSEIESLQPFLAQQGVSFIDADVYDSDGSFGFDTVLVDIDAIVERKGIPRE
ncbi:hypothetical protein TK90_2751 (plasmid) [Thioalkalivibrio sp. K90mix]|uniref:hypothetical protein n=1 Tax=Thioalkalivibrio sp. (strain K90mix) TaxID=396595 RepID=UPI000195A5EB|nr:hypothetical protein [Thioalkalivibrio sp. K90mix]ADC73236.1 hypothetical protein TK90_2751 [Thioalkalivibrio sp. K90mix]